MEVENPPLIAKVSEIRREIRTIIEDMKSVNNSKLYLLPARETFLSFSLIQHNRRFTLDEATQILRPMASAEVLQKAMKMARAND